jgi:Bacterial Ig domain
MKSHSESLMKCIVRLVTVLAIVFLVRTPSPAQTSPTILGSVGYINGTPLTTHTSNGFNSSSGFTLVAFVSTHPSWNGLPVTINGLSDNLGNTWNVLNGPTLFSGSSFTLMSAIYYVNSPVTSANHTVTVQLSNPAPLVFHIFAVSGSDLSGPPIVSAITDPGAGATSAVVTTAPITVPSNSLLLSWVKNETSATASTLNGYTLDATQSTSFLWAESQSPISSGSYTGNFQYDSAIGWQTAIVGLRPSTGPVASNQTVVADQDTPVSITLTATSLQGFPLTYTVVTQPTHGVLSGSAPDLTYTPNSGYTGSDLFTFNANDGTTNSNTATVSITIRGPAPVINSTVGYINGTPLTAHTSNAFNSLGASTLIAFVSSHPTWNGLPVSLNGLTDNQGNTWNVLTGPTQFIGSSFTLMSAIYYVNSPATSANHTVTTQLSNPAPLVFHVFAVSNSDVTGPPIVSAISDPGAGGSSANVTSAAITVPVNNLLLSWVKNETSATASALNGYTLDTAQSTSYLWAESQTPNSAGSYTGNFQYDSAIGWQTAIVAVKPHLAAPPTPTITSHPANLSNQASAGFSFNDVQLGVNFLCQLDNSGFGMCSSPASYAGLADGSHTFYVKAQDSSGNQSLAATFSWTVDTTAPPIPVITSAPASLTNQTSANFSFSDNEAGVSFQCQLDANVFSACSSPQAYSGLSQGTHTFKVLAQDPATNQSVAANFAWNIDTTAPPKPVLTSTPADPTNQTSATFGFTDSQAGLTFLCQLDNSVSTACSSPVQYLGPLSQGKHTFSVRAKDGAGNISAISKFSWTVDVTAPPPPIITATPTNPTTQTSAKFSFSDSEKGVIFLCQLDSSGFSSCSSPKSYSGLTQGAHTFFVKAQDTAGNQSAATRFTWTIN